LVLQPGRAIAFGAGAGSSVVGVTFVRRMIFFAAHRRYRLCRGFSVIQSQ
jgi:hypothetical protein